MPESDPVTAPGYGARCRRPVPAPGGVRYLAVPEYSASTTVAKSFITMLRLSFSEGVR